MIKETEYKGIARQVKYYEDENGCFVPTGRALNQDGYLRVFSKIENRLVMMHRFAWEAEVGPIQKGYEIDHKCKNRHCFNVNHLQCIDGKQHAIESNKERYRGRIEFGKKLIGLGIHLSEVAKVCEVGEFTPYNWRQQMDLPKRGIRYIIPFLEENSNGN